jgi:hypothetical protein
MARKSMYERGGDGLTSGGLDGYLGPEAQDHSNLPDHTEDVEQEPETPIDCKGKDAAEAVCQIAELEKQREPGQGGKPGPSGRH